jgi:hypothetical protein
MIRVGLRMTTCRGYLHSNSLLIIVILRPTEKF